MQKRNNHILVFINSLIIVLIVCCSNDAYYDYSNRFQLKQEFDSIFMALNTDGFFNGEILIAQSGKIITHNHYGYADLLTEKPFNEQSIFEIASLTKPFTALAIAKLVSDKKLNYEDTLGTFFPDIPYSQLSIHQLVTHTSGLPDYSYVFYPNWDYKKIACNENLLSVLVSHKPILLFKPEKEWHYSNIGFTLLGMIYWN
jgi:CubicO group peptidase (beta-lactamase class C family)